MESTDVNTITNTDNPTTTTTTNPTTPTTPAASHTITPPAHTKDKANVPICTHFQQGNCKYGKHCWKNHKKLPLL